METEAYIGPHDLACHARAGRTRRTEVMFGRAGIAYVYFTYGMHWLFNVVTEDEGFPAAVLLRALEPLEGLDSMQRRRGVEELSRLCCGPACLTQALAIGRAENGADLCSGNAQLWIERGSRPARMAIGTGARIGIGRTPEPWLSKPWRFYLRHS